MNASFSPEVVGIIRNKILATIEKVLSIKFPFIRDLGIGSNPFYNLLFYRARKENNPTNKGIVNTVRNNVKTDSLIKKWVYPTASKKIFFAKFFSIFLVRIDCMRLYAKKWEYE